MSPVISLSTEKNKGDCQPENQLYQKGVIHLCENGIEKVPRKYVFPIDDRPNSTEKEVVHCKETNIKLPVIDFAQLQGANRSNVVKELATACEQYGFFQVCNQTFSTYYQSLTTFDH